MTSEFSEPIERWTAKRRVALVVSILKGETSVAEAAHQHALTVAEVIARWADGQIAASIDFVSQHERTVAAEQAAAGVQPIEVRS